MAVIGAGFLGARVVTELLLLGNDVVGAPSPSLPAPPELGFWFQPATESVYDSGLARTANPQAFSTCL